MSIPFDETYLNSPLVLLTTHQPPAFLFAAFAYPANCAIYPKESFSAKVSKDSNLF
jgi:hypothetical protein